MKSRLLSRLIIGLFSVIFLTFQFCDTTPTDSSGEPSVVEGYVTTDTGNEGFSKPAQGVQGATVTLERMKSDGSYQTVSNEEVTSDTSGYFKIETNLSGERQLIVKAENANNTWRAIVTSAVTNGQTVQCEPLTTETTVEVDVLATLMAGNDGSVNMSSAAVETQNAITATVATESHLYDPDYAKLAQAIRYRMQARSQAMLSDYSTSQLALVDSAKIRHQAALETALFHANGATSAIESAYETYNDGWSNAYPNAGIDKTSIAKAEQVGEWVFGEPAKSLSSTAEFALIQKANMHKVRAFVAAVESIFDSLSSINGARAENMTAIQSFGADLQNTVRNASGLSAIENALTSYHSDVVSELAVALDSSNQAVTTQMILDVDDAITNPATGARNTLRNTIRSAVQTSGEINLNQVVNAHNTFYTTVSDEFDAIGALRQDHANLSKEIIILTNIMVL